MDSRLQQAYTKVTNKYHSAVQTDTKLEYSNINDGAYYNLEKKSKLFWEQYQEADAEFKSLLERCKIDG